MATTDPLHLLPAELVLRILEFTPLSGISSLTRLTRSWNTFIDTTHQDAIYSAKTSRNPNQRDFRDFSSFETDSSSFTRYYAGVTSWKDLCKRQTLLSKNWSRRSPITRELIIGSSSSTRDPVWRFKPDFKRRLILSTHHTGDMKVTDMDTDQVIWSLSPQTVRPYAHLEYQDGTAVWDREGNALEVWRTDQPGCQRGEFRRIAVLDHDSQTRGFQLSYDNLCVVSTDGKGYVYEGMTQSGTPRLKTEIDIEEGAVGHVYQDADVVVYSMGVDGYYVYDKLGKRLGIMEPKWCTSSNFHIEDVSQSPGRRPHTVENLIGGANQCTSQKPSTVRTKPIQVKSGTYPDPGENSIWLDDDEWGAVSLCGSLMVGISRGGRVFVCSDWRSSLESVEKMQLHSSIVECDSDGSTFDFGGWLSVKDHRVLFEIEGGQVYVLGLTDDNKVAVNNTARPSFSFPTGFTSQLAVPVSFMAIYDDCIMTTYTTASHGALRLPTKAVRALSLAPDVSGNDEEASKEVSAQQVWVADGLDLWATFLSGDADLAMVDGLVAGEDDWEDMEDLN
ncbi:uncharacterized protein RCC_09972 [Ramularia collo-cygni]|uniref:F-box domain-containing protein n=1 Tax=Ramularia collo-cygni TaxID=112498 RepID=A0A2D3V8C7_9PEZI|nr:uncharacterized protein RCC_09972 [Ramularia collo-cygni]CZT24253.1 uncharacterized protein RCC_09972 [Ramularia collo-cygni]